MDYEIHLSPDCLRASLTGRETIEETRAFLLAVARANEQHRRGGILIDVHRSRPIFNSAPRGFLEGLRRLARSTTLKIALVGDTEELRLSHEYLALRARQQGLNVWSFPFEGAAMRWLSNRRRSPERRRGTERRSRAVLQPETQQRRQRVRRVGTRPRDTNFVQVSASP